MHDFFELDGIRSDAVGVQLQAPLSFGSPVPRVTAVSIPGRNGDLQFFDGSYENLPGHARCFVLKNNAARAIAAVNKWLLNPAYKRLKSSDDQTIYRLAKIANGAEIAVRMKRLAPFEIEFDCKPQKFLVSGDYAIKLTTPMPISNAGVGGLPLIKVLGNGVGTLKVNGYAVTLKSLSDSVFIDCETSNAYKGMINKNDEIQCDDFPKLIHGANEITWTGGIKSVEIVPRWFDL